MKLTTEQDSLYTAIDKMSTRAILNAIHEEDKKVTLAVAQAIPAVEQFTNAVLPNIQQGGRLIYIGAGTSGRLGVLDASEIPPTFGLEYGRVLGIIAGGDIAIRKSQEGAEDDEQQALADLSKIAISPQDSILGITASGRTPYVLSACRHARALGCVTGGLMMNKEASLSTIVDFPISVVVGPEFITGSTRMKSGTAQKLVLNMISTTLMARMGRVSGNKMSHMQLSNDKLKRRGVAMLMEQYNVSESVATTAVAEHKNVYDASLSLAKQIKQ